MESRSLSLALTALLLAAPVAAQQGANQIVGPGGDPPDDPFEGNATCWTAQELVPGSYAGLVVSHGSPDHFRVVVPAQDSLVVTVVVRSFVHDFTLHVFDSCDTIPQVFAPGLTGTHTFQIDNPDDEPSARVLAFKRGVTLYGSSGHAEYGLSFARLGEPTYPDLCDGWLAGCPCGNEGDPGTGCEHLGGHGARLIIGGCQFAVLGGLEVHAEDLPPGMPAMLFSSALDTPLVAWPFHDGVLCYGGGAIVRHGAAISDAAGLATWSPYQIDLASGRDPGQELAVQVWYRDGPTSVCGTGSNFTQAKRVFAQP